MIPREDNIGINKQPNQDVFNAFGWQEIPVFALRIINYQYSTNHHVVSMQSGPDDTLDTIFCLILKATLQGRLRSQ